MFVELMKIEKALNECREYLDIKICDDYENIRVTNIVGDKYILNLDAIRFMSNIKLKELIFNQLDI